MDERGVENTEGWDVLSKVLVLPKDGASKLAAATSVDLNKRRVSVSFSGELGGYPFEGAFGIEPKEKKPTLFVEGKLKPTILGRQFTVDVLGVFGVDGVVLSGTIDATLTVPVIELELIRPLLVIGFNSAGVPCGGFGGMLVMRSLETSFVMLLDSKDPQKCVFIAAVGDLNLTRIVESIAHMDVPREIEPLLNIVQLTHIKGEEVSIPANRAAKLAAALDNKDAKTVSEEISAVNNQLTLPTSLDGLVLVVRKKGEQWSITDLRDKRRRHYQLEKRADGQIQLTVAPQIYCVQKDTRVANNDFKPGFFVSGRVSILGFGGQAEVEITRPEMNIGYPSIKLKADLDRLVVKDARLFSISSATDADKGPHLSFETLKSPGVKLEWPSLGDPHFDLDAKVTLLGASGQTVVKISARECSFSLRADVATVSGSISVIPLKVRAAFAIHIGSIDIKLLPEIDVGDISVGLTISGDGAALDDVTVNVLGARITIPGVDIPIPSGRTLSQLIDVVKDEVGAAIRDHFDPSKELERIAGAVADAVADGAEEVGRKLGEFFTTGGISFGGGSGGTEEPPNTAGWTITQIRDVVGTKRQNEDPKLAIEDMKRYYKVNESTWFIFLLFTWWKFAPAIVAGLLRQGGYSAWEIASGFGALGMPAAEAALLLKGAGFNAQNVGSALLLTPKRSELFPTLPEGYGGTYDSVAKILKSAGYDIDSTAHFLRGFCGQSHGDTVRILRDAGYSAEPEWPVPMAPYLIASQTRTGPRLLSCRPNDTNNLNLQDREDGSRRQLWYLEGGGGVYVISRFGNHSPRLLSCAHNGSIVDLVYTPDSSDRQRWKLTPTGDGSFTIESMGSLSTSRKYLSCTVNGAKIDLFDKDDGSGNQQWRLIRWPATDETEYLVRTFRPQSEGSADTLTHTGDGVKVELSEKDDDPAGQWRQRWAFDRTADGTYRIRPAGQRCYLSCLGNGTLIDLFAEDDKSGRQRWRLNANATDGVTWFTLEPAGGLSSAHKYLSYATDSNALGLWHSEDGSGRQRWRLEQA